MLLYLDFGNSVVKYALFSGDSCVTEGILPENLPDLVHFEAIRFAVVCAVTEVPTHLFSYHFPVKILHQTDTCIQFPSYDATTLGIDRIVLAEAARAQYPNQAVLAICLGTCITYNFINPAGEFIGGAISPGLQLRAKSMHDYTAKLPRIHPHTIHQTFGTNTQTNLNAGVVNGVQFEMEGFIQVALQSFPSCNIFICGGDALLFQQDFNYLPDAMWIGMQAMLT